MPDLNHVIDAHTSQMQELRANHPREQGLKRFFSCSVSSGHGFPSLRHFRRHCWYSADPILYGIFHLLIGGILKRHSGVEPDGDPVLGAHPTMPQKFPFQEDLFLLERGIMPHHEAIMRTCNSLFCVLGG